MSEAGSLGESPPMDQRAAGHSSIGTLRVGALAEALAPNVLQSLGPAELAGFLTQRRWYGAKAGAPSAARIRDVVALEWEGGPFAIARVEVAPAGGGAAALYQLPLCVRSTQELGDAPPKNLVARVVAGDEEGLLFDAVEDGAFLRALAESFGKGAAFASDGHRWIVEPIGAKALVLPPNADVRVGSAEQSNTSIIIDQMAILKLFRKLEPGPHPDVELTRFLTVDAGFAHTPVLLGEAHFEDDGSGERTVAAMLQEFLPKSSDAWSYVLDRSRPYFEAAKDAEPRNAFLPEAERLGSITRELHDTLGRGMPGNTEFARERVTRDQVTLWAAGASEWVRRALSLLERQLGAKALPKERAAEADALVRRRDQFLRDVNEIVETLGSDAGYAIRIHGDYHLGQVLRTASDDFMIIDFEGEPARTLAERRQKASPLRDVAGMLRSFAYAAATLGMEAKKLDVPTRELRIGRWERDTRQAFLRGYLSREAGREKREAAVEILPGDDAHTRALLRLFEMEKAFYELAYELNNRPDWVWIPLRGIAKLMTR